MNRIFDNKFLYDFEPDNPIYSFARLKELSGEQGYITYDDVLRLFPEAEQNIDYLDQIYVSMHNAGILFIDENIFEEVPTEDSADEDADDSHNGRAKIREDNYLSNVEPDNLVGLYINEATRHPLLTFDEEVDLAKRIEQGFLARKEISDLGIKSAKRLGELQLLLDDSWTAVDCLIKANSRLVISIAKKYTNRGVPFLDLIQEGNIGLMRAAKRFDYRRGYKFGTYATWWIRQAVGRALAEQSRTIRLPVHINDQLSKMFRIQNQFRQQLGREPEVSEIAEAMGVSSEKIQQLSKNARIPLSLDMPMSVEGDGVLGDFIEDHESPDPGEVATLSLLAQHLDQALALLPPREAQILKLRYGLANGEAHTLREVGIKIGVSRERIRQIEVQAINRLRHPVIQNKLRSYLG
jgi:RNA polymerase primary sigma factor